MIKINSTVFDIVKTEFFAYVYLGQRGLEQSVDIDFRTKSKTINETDWRFHISSQALDIQIPSLESLPGTVFDISELVDEEPQMSLYLYEHQPIKNALIQFYAWNQTQIGFKLTGLVDLEGEPGFGIDSELLVECDLEFEGVVVDEPDFDKAVLKLSTYFKIEQFHPPINDDIGRAWFRPKTLS